MDPKLPPPNPAVPHREDCWSEGATAALIDAWANRFVELDRGHLRQKHWLEVAHAVNTRRTAVNRPPRTDVQCKNRIDTIKKKYKAERARIVESGSASTSSWPFYDRLDLLIGNLNPPAKKIGAPSPPDPPVAVPLPRWRGSPLPPPAAVASRPLLAGESLLRKGLYSAAAAAAAAAREEDEVEEEVEEEEERSSAERSVKEEELEERAEGDNGVKDLAQAILRFGEVYERVEVAKQKQMLELEKQRMEFAKGLELQRMKMFVDSQVQLEKIKRAKWNATGSSAATADFS